MKMIDRVKGVVARCLTVRTGAAPTRQPTKVEVDFSSMDPIARKKAKAATRLAAQKREHAVMAERDLRRWDDEQRFWARVNEQARDDDPDDAAISFAKSNGWFLP